MNEADGVSGLVVLGQREQIRELARAAAEPWRVSDRSRRRTRGEDAPECDLWHGDCRPRAFPRAS